MTHICNNVLFRAIRQDICGPASASCRHYNAIGQSRISIGAAQPHLGVVQWRLGAAQQQSGTPG